MRCPYLKEANVKLCGNSAWRKMIVQQAADTERREMLYRRPMRTARSTAGAAKTRRPIRAVLISKRKLAEYCAASAVPQLVPLYGICVPLQKRQLQILRGVPRPDPAAVG